MVAWYLAIAILAQECYLFLFCYLLFLLFVHNRLADIFFLLSTCGLLDIRRFVQRRVPTFPSLLLLLCSFVRL